MIKIQQTYDKYKLFFGCIQLYESKYEKKEII
jgi:hypothetical protein